MKLLAQVKRVLEHPLIRSGSWMMGSGVVQAVTAFLANLVLVRFLVPEEFGRFALVQANIGLVGTFFGLRLNNVLVREGEQELTVGGRDRYFSALVGETAVVGVGATGVLLTAGLWDWRAALLLVGTLLGLWTNAQKALYERRFRYRTLSLLEGGSHLASHLLAVIGIMVGVGAAVLYLREWVQTLGQLAGLYHMQALQKFHLRWLDFQDWKRIVQAIRRFWMNDVLEQTFDRLVILLVGGLAGERATGFFSQARRLAMIPHQVAQPIAVRVSFNYFSHHISKAKSWSIVKKVLLGETFALLIVGVTAIAWADPIIPVLFGRGWEPVVPLLQAMGGVMVGMTPFNTMKAYCMAAGLMRPFILVGRGVQYGALAICGGLIVWFQMPPDLMVAVALSVGFLVGGLLLLPTLGMRASQKSPGLLKEPVVRLEGEA